LRSKAFGGGDAVLAQRGGGFSQTRIAGRSLECARSGCVGAAFVADRPQVIGERAPGLGQVRRNLQRASQVCDRFLAAAACCQRLAEQQHRRRVIGDGLEYLGRLSDGERGLALEQPRRVVERDFEHACP
jgi:hypothetical protein